MNNQQFRRLVLDTPSARTSSDSNNVGATSRGVGGTPSALGSRMRSSIPMTPRSVGGISSTDFARQLAERNGSGSETRKFRSSAAPKGAKLPAGYRDRTQDRSSTEDDDKASRVKALEDMVKLGQIDQRTFENLRDDIIGGDIASTHLIKGLDWKLLKRVRGGEDVLNATEEAKDEDKLGRQEPADDENVDDEFEKLEEKEIAPLVREEKAKKGEMAPLGIPGLVAGRKRTRDDIIAELKASRAADVAVKAAAMPQLGSKFRKLGEKEEKSRIERDERGREVLITVDAEGKIKRKVRRSDTKENELNKKKELLMPDKDLKPLGMEVPEIPEPPEENEDDDIFQGVGADYDPLDGITSDSSSDEESPGTESKKPRAHSPQSIESDHPRVNLPPSTLAAPRNYFNDSKQDTSSATSTQPINPLNDPTLLTALKKSATLSSHLTSTEKPTPDSAAAARRAAMLSSHDRDADDMDLGFGSSRFEDEDDGEERRVKLSVWDRGNGGDDEDGRTAKGGADKRKRGPKKRRGDKDSAADVLRVMEGRKNAAG